MSAFNGIVNATKDEMSPIAIPEHETLKTNALTWADRARALPVIDEASFRAKAEDLKDINRALKEVNAKFKDPVSLAHQAHKAMKALQNSIVVPLTEAKTVSNKQLGDYRAEQQRLQAELQRALEAEARKIEEEQRLAEAVELEEQGYTEEAEAIIDEPILPPVIIAPPPTPKVDGVSFRENWKAKVTDKRAAIEFILRHWQHISHLIDINESELNKVARQQKSNMKMDGVRVYCKQVPVGRGS